MDALSRSNLDESSAKVATAALKCSEKFSKTLGTHCAKLVEILKLGGLRLPPDPPQAASLQRLRRSGFVARLWRLLMLYGLLQCNATGPGGVWGG